jgi:gliding motility-associated-like protein
MLKVLLRSMAVLALLPALCWTPLRAQEFQFQFLGPDTLYANNACEAILSLDMDSLTVQSLIGANVTDTVLTITGQYMLGDVLPAGTVVTFNWTATDDQGNDSIFVFTITVVDTLAPNFSSVLPPDITVACDGIPAPPVLTIFDNCDPAPVLTFNQVQTSGPCPGNYSILREWIATDLSGNSRSHQQMITVQDLVPPMLTGIPADTLVLCHAIPAPPATGTAIQASDNCDSNPTISFSTQTFAGACADEYVIERTWTATDNCGNATTLTQVLTVVDTLGPEIQGVPADITVDCDAIPAPPIIGSGGVTATDLCAANSSLIFIQGSNQDPDPASCDHYNYEITRSWVATDDCGNISTAEQVIAVRDRQAPTLYCPAADTVLVGAGICLAEGSLARLLFASDNCTPTGTAVLIDTANILNTSGTPLLSGKVDDILFSLPFAGLPANYSTGNVELTISLINADAEQPSEFYRIFDEDGQLLGQTQNVPAQCGSGQTVLTSLTPAQINAWAQDGFINFLLVPEGDGVEAINQICPGGRVGISLRFDYETSPPAGLTLQYRVGSGPLKNLSSGTESLAPGDYPITVIATDCSGNADSCGYVLTVLDRQNPTLVCPPALQVSTDLNTCSATTTLPFPLQASDNCGFPQEYQASLPAQPLVFFQDPNAGVVPQDVLATFNNAVPAGTGFATLRVFLRADIANPGEFFEVFGENNTFLGITGPASPLQECTQEAVFSFFVSQAQIQAWSQDGQMQFRLVSNKDVINFSDFINPCSTLQPNNTDGISYARFELSYNAVQTQYSIIEDLSGTTVASGVLVSPANPPQELLPIGAYTVRYRLEDSDGNISECFWPLTVADEVPPVVQCKPGLFVRTNPSGLVNLTLQPSDILEVPATDNCGLAGIDISPNTFSCNDAGSNFNVRLIAFDLSGNSDTCFSLVAVQNEPLTPMFALDTCGGNLQLIPDTTFTVPSPGSGDFFLFTWTGPNGFSSNLSHPVIPNPQEINAGTYTLTVQGLTGCSSTGFLLLDILPGGAFRPVLETNSPVCQGGTIRLSTDWQGAQRYEWVHIPSGTIYETNQPELEVPADLLNSGNWTLQVFPQPGCPSLVSVPEEIVIQAISLQLPAEVQACEGDSLALPANAVNGATFVWTAPNGVIYNGLNPVVPVISGVYRLQALSPQGCPAMDSLTLNLLQRPTITALSNSCPDCVGGVEECELVPTIFPPDAGGTYQYRWTNPAGMVFSQDPKATLTNVTGGQSGLYTLIVEKLDNTCRSVPFSVFITLNDRPLTPVIGVVGGANPHEVCAGETVVLQVQNTSYSGNVRYVWHGPLGSDTTGIPSLSIPGITLNQGGAYTLEVTVNGCVSNPSNSQVLVVNPIPFPPVISANTPLCEGDTLLICGDFVAGATYEWVGPLGSSGPDFCLVIPEATTNLSGLYRARIAVKGCLSAFGNEIDVEVRENPAAPLISDNCGGAICRDQANSCLLTVINPDPADQYFWYAGGVDTLIGFSGSTPFLALDLPGNYGDGQYSFYVVAGRDGCRSVNGLAHTIQINTIPEQMADAGPDVVICDGATLTICAQQPPIGSGQWLQTGGPAVTLLDPGSPCTAVQGYQPGAVMTFSWQLSNGACINYDRDTTAVTISRFEEAIAETLVERCRVNATQISASPGQYGPGQWTQTPGQSALGVTIAAPGNPNTGVSGLQPGNTYFFLWTLPNGACPESSVLVQVDNFDDQAFAGADRSDCGYGCLSLPLNADFATLGGGRWYSPDPGISITPGGETSATACGLKDGPNLFIWELNQGLCGNSAYDTLVVNYAMGPTAVNDTIQVPFAGQVLIPVLNNDQIFGTVSTSLVGAGGQGTMNKVAEGTWVYTPPIQFTGTTEFRYRVCSAVCPEVCSEARIILEVEVNNACAVPTIITPNQDGVNDALVIPCLAQENLYPRNSLSIFNQWGDEVYRAAPYRNNWEGTFRGQLLPAGTYFFVFEPGNDEPVASGFILIKY